MSKIVTKKAHFMLETDGFSIHTFEISRKLTKSEWNHCKEKLYDQNHVSSKVCIYKESKGIHRVSLYEKYGLRITLEYAHDQENSRGYYVRIVVNPRKASIRMYPTLVFSHLKRPVSPSCKQHFMHFWTNQHSMASLMTII